jgi:hypothetical protein
VASITVLVLISKMPEKARKTTSTVLVIHMACIEIPICGFRGYFIDYIVYVFIHDTRIIYIPSLSNTHYR